MARARTCAVCGDTREILPHYGVLSCYGCKAFFRRAIVEKREFRCQFNEDCSVAKKNRNRCKGCRFKKCISVGMDSGMVREDRKTAAKPLVPLSGEGGEQRSSIASSGPPPEPQPRTPEPPPTTSAQADFLDFLVRIEDNTLNCYDEDYAVVDEETTQRLNGLYGRNFSLEEGLQRPEIVCPRTKLNFACERNHTAEDMCFFWHRHFVYVADWALSIPQFRQLSARLFRENFAPMCWTVYLSNELKWHPKIGLPIGNGSHSPFDDCEFTLGMPRNRYAMLMKMVRQLTGAVEKLQCDVPELLGMRALMLFQNEYGLSEKVELGMRQGELLLMISVIRQVWHFESDSHLMMNVFKTLDLSSVIVELITQSAKDVEDLDTKPQLEFND